MRLFSRYSLFSLISALSLVVLLSAPAGAENAIRFTNAQAQPGGLVTVDVIMENDLVLGAAVVPFRWTSPDLELLSITIVRDRFVGGLRDTSSIEGFGPQTGSILIYPKISIFDRGMVLPGVGVLARLLFQVSPGALDQTVRVDSIYQQIAENAWRRPEYSDLDGLQSIVPSVYHGEILVDDGVIADPSLEVLPRSLDFTAVIGAQNPPSQSLTVLVGSVEPAHWQTSWKSSWLNVVPASGTTTGFPTVDVVLDGLGPGIYLDTILVYSPQAINSPYPVRVRLDVMRPAMSVSRERVTLEAVTTPPTSSSESVRVEATDNAEIDWQAFWASDWLIVSSAGGVTPADIELAVDADLLVEGVYRDTIVISSAAASNAPRLVLVEATVVRPRLTLPEGEVWITGFLSPPTVKSTSRPIHSDLDVPMDWTASWNSSWLLLDPMAGTTPSLLMFYASIQGLAAGTYFDTVTLVATSFASDSVTIPVRLDIVSGGNRDEFDRIGVAVSPQHSNPYSLSSDASLRISYTLRDPMRIDLTVYDLLGRRVRTLVAEDQASGTHEVDWDGRDGAGNLVSSGHYFYRITTPHGSVTRRVVMIK